MTDICVDFQDEDIQLAALQAITRFPNWRELLEAYLLSLGFPTCCEFCNDSYDYYCDGYGMKTTTSTTTTSTSTSTSSSSTSTTSPP